MRNSPVLLSIALLAACGSGPEWAGRYTGDVLAERTDCATSAPLDPATDTITAAIVERESGRIALNTACLVEFDVLDDSTARMVPTSCDTALADGTPARYTYLEGALHLDGDELELRASVRFERDGLCDSSRLTFVGLRE